MRVAMRGVFLLVLLGPFLTLRVLSGTWATGDPVPGNRDKESLPDTPAGRCARAYLEAFNSGQDHGVREFTRRYRPRADSAEVTRRAGQERRLRRAWGTLTPVRVPQSSEHVVTCLIRPSASADWLVFRIELAEGAPQPAIERFTRTGVGSPAGLEVVPGDEEILRLADRAMPIDAAMTKLIEGGAPISKIKAQARKNRMYYIQEEGLLKVIDGTTSMNEVLRCLRSDNKK